MKYEEKRKYLLTNYNKVMMKGAQKNMDLLTCVFDNGKISIIKRRSQNDCVHEQLANVRFTFDKNLNPKVKRSSRTNMRPGTVILI